MTVHFHEEDLPADVRFVDGPIAAGDLGAGGQLVLIAAPGADIAPAVKSVPLGDVDKAIGSRFADTIVERTR